MQEFFFTKLKTLIAEAKRLQASGFGDQEPEEATKQLLLEPLFHALGFGKKTQYSREYKILGDSVDYLLRSERPLLFVEAKSLLDPAADIFEKHSEQVRRYLQNYRLSPDITKMEQPVKWILLTNFAQFHFIRVNEIAPSFVFGLNDLWTRREELWELLAFENLEAGRIDELYDQHKKALLDQQFLADLKRWRLLIANGFALRNQQRTLDEITLASQQLLDRFIFCLMLENHRLVEYNKLARAYGNYEILYGRASKTFAEVVRESLFVEIKNDFNTELFEQPLLCDELSVDNAVLAAVIGHEPLAPELAAQCGFDSGQGELIAFRHLYRYDFSLMSSDVMGAVYERFLAHRLFQEGGRIVIEDTDELRKKEGIYYTPRYIVDYIVTHTLGEKIKPILAEARALLGYKNYQAAFEMIGRLSEIKVLDPAMGSGSFLLGAFDSLVAAYREYNAECERSRRTGGHDGEMLFDAPTGSPRFMDRLGSRVMQDNIFGVDLDRQAVEVAKLNLWIRLMNAEGAALLLKLRDPSNGRKPRSLLPTLASNLKHGNSLIADASVAGSTAFVWEKEFPEIIKRGGFDVVIGNPPYERIQTMLGSAPQAVEFLKANYRSAVSGNFDIYICFIEHGMQLLNVGGRFGFICPSKFFQSEYGEETRVLLSEGKFVSRLVNFGHLQIFSQATIYTCLLFLRKEPQKEFPYFKVEDLESWRAGGGALPVQVAADSLSRKEWNFVPSANQPLFHKINLQPRKLEEVANIFVGLQTSADDVFILNYLGETQTTIRLQSKSLGGEWSFEKALLHPLVSGTDVPAYGPLPKRQFIIFPYSVKKDTAALIEFDLIQEKFPKTAEYLIRNRAVLEAREGGKAKTERWHGYIYLKNLARQELPKLCVPRLVNQLHAAWDEKGEVFLDNVDVGGVTVKPEFDSLKMPYLLALLNSRLLRWFFPFVSVPFRGNYFSANRQFLGQLPIKLIDAQKKGEVKLEKEIVERAGINQARHKQSGKLPVVLHRLILHSQNRVPCNLAHYLQPDFTAAVQAKILIDDVQRAGFIHAIEIGADGPELVFGATLAEKIDGPARLIPVLRLVFQEEALRQFVYACWKQFLDGHSRQKKWTKGKKPEAVYPLLVNTLEPLVYFQSGAGDNLRAIRELMVLVAAEAGSADLAALEEEINRLDAEIDDRVYDLYGLTEDEKKLVAGPAS